MAGPAPKAPRKGRAATPALLSGQTDTTAEAEKPPAAPPVDQSTGAAGPEAGAASTHASEQAAGEGAASAVAGIAAAPAALPSGAAAGVDPHNPESEARGSVPVDHLLVAQDLSTDAVSTAPAGDASANPAGASQGAADVFLAAVAALGDGDAPTLPPPPTVEIVGPAGDVQGEALREAILDLIANGEIAFLPSPFEVIDFADLQAVNIIVTSKITCLRAGFGWVANGERRFVPGDLTMGQLFTLIHDDDFSVTPELADE